MMHTSFSETFDKLEKTKSDILKALSTVNEIDYYKSINNRWSIAQILTHIVTSEKLALDYMRKKYLGVEQLKNSAWKEPSKLILLQLSQRLPIRYQAPKAIVEKTPAPLPFHRLSEEWSTLRADLASFLDSIPDEHVRKMIFKHPIAGMFNAAQGLVFLREHLMHHVPQINRNLMPSRH